MKYIIIFFIALLPLVSFSQEEADYDDDSDAYMLDEVSLLNYSPGGGIGFISDDDGYLMKVMGYVQPYAEYRSILGDDRGYYRFRIRRARLRLSGTDASRKIDYRVSLEFGRYHDNEFEHNNITLYDAYIRYRINRRWRVIVGQRSLATDNRELRMSNYALQMADRSRLVAAFAAIRDKGIMLEGNIRLYGTQYLRPTLEITSGDGVNGLSNYGGLKYGLRVNYNPFGLFRGLGEFRGDDWFREQSPKLSIGVAYSYIDGVSSARGDRNGSLLYWDAEDNLVLPKYQKIIADFLFKYKGLTILGEYVDAKAFIYGADKIVRRSRNGVESTNFAVDGVNDVEAKIRSYMALGSGLNLQLSYLFKNDYSVQFRYTKFTPEAVSWLNNGALYNRPEYYGIGITKYLTEDYATKIQISVTYNTAKDGTEFPSDYSYLGTNYSPPRYPVSNGELMSSLLFSIAF